MIRHGNRRIYFFTAWAPAGVLCSIMFRGAALRSHSQKYLRPRSTNPFFIVPNFSTVCEHFKLGSGNAEDASVHARKLRKELHNTIKVAGPISTAEFIKLANTHPQYGYYSYKEIFGRAGDFVTAPEISQLFGEILTVHFLKCLQPLIEGGRRVRLNLIELGPGKGTLLHDILRTFSQFDVMKGKISNCILMENSQRLCQIQSQKLRGDFPDIKFHWSPTIEDALFRASDAEISIVFSNEFYDALPIYTFQMDTDLKWKEILIDGLDVGDDIEFRFVRSQQETPMAKLLKLENLTTDAGQFIEFCPEARRINELIAAHILSRGGIFVAADYGNDISIRDKPSLRAIRNHCFRNPLEMVGECDLSSDVDFSHFTAAFPLKDFKADLTEQLEFLSRNGIEARLVSLSRGKSKEIQASLHQDYIRLVDPRQMGKIYKVFSATCL